MAMQFHFLFLATENNHILAEAKQPDGPEGLTLPAPVVHTSLQLSLPHPLIITHHLAHALLSYKEKVAGMTVRCVTGDGVRRSWECKGSGLGHSLFQRVHSQVRAHTVF